MKLLKKSSLSATPMSHSFSVKTLSDFNRESMHEIQINETVCSNIHKNERLIKLNTKPGQWD